MKDLFFCHGNTYKIGETEEHEDATENSYESDSNRSVSIDEDGNYTIQGEVISVIPQSDIKALLSGFVGALKDCVHLFQLNPKSGKFTLIQSPEEYVKSFSVATSSGEMAFSGQSASMRYARQRRQQFGW